MLDVKDIAIINGARSGQSSDTWDSAAKTNYDLVRTNDLQPAGLTEKLWGRHYALFSENLRRYLGHEPLLGLVDKQRGY